ncbi:MAG: dicarboxylate/amino acid:cation symporter [Rubripirellula sp.]|nr:dicarboxylate/amino acid:cation symporter [Rubripirellula sp.]
MRNLALHWQILIGMITGCCIGLALNMAASERSVTLTSNLPTGVVEAEVNDSSSLTVIRYLVDGKETTVTVDPASRSNNSIRTYKQLAQRDPLASQIYNQHGKSLAKQVGDWCKKIGGLFLRMLQMVSVPLIITSLLSGILSLSGREGVGNMFKRTLSYYLTTSLLAILTGLLLVNLIRPGLQTTNNAPTAAPTIDESHQTSLVDVMFAQIEAAIPSNPLAAITQPNFLSIIAFTIIFGVFALRVGGTTVTRLQDLTNAGLEVMMAITTAIIRLAPFGVFFLITAVLATQGSSVFKSLGWYVLTVAAALLIHACITLPLILKIIAKRQPLEYARAMSPALLTAFSSASSNGTLPVTLTNVEQRAGISNRTGSFVLPLGATINMDGTALYEAVAVLFIAQLHYGYNLPVSQQIIVAITALLASIGAAGIPHAGLVMMVIILQAVGLPLEMQGIILAVDRVLDMARTSVNVWSDSCGCAVVEALDSKTSSLIDATEPTA